MGWLQIIMLVFRLGALLWQFLPMIKEIFDSLKSSGQSSAVLLEAIRQAAKSKSVAPIEQLHHAVMDKKL